MDELNELREDRQKLLGDIKILRKALWLACACLRRHDVVDDLSGEPFTPEVWLSLAKPA